MKEQLSCMWNIAKNDSAFYLGLGIGLFGTGIVILGLSMYIAVKEVESHFQ